MTLVFIFKGKCFKDWPDEAQNVDEPEGPIENERRGLSQ